MMSQQTIKLELWLGSSQFVLCYGESPQRFNQSEVRKSFAVYIQ